MRTKEKAYAKINLALYVGKKSGDFHPLKGINASVNLFDSVTLSTRFDDKIVLNPSGIWEYVCDCVPERDNAYKAAALFRDKYSTRGVDIYVRKSIPLSGGMGGSSADAAAVLRGMAKLYGVTDDLTELANELGSDTAYMLKGGFAEIGGRGEDISPIDCARRLHLVVVYPESGVNTSACFEEFDRLESPSSDPSQLKKLVDFLQCADDEDFKSGLSACKNDLYAAACSLNSQVKTSFEAIKALSPDAVFMTGSGSTVCGVYSEEMLARWAVDKLKKSGFDSEYLYTLNEKKSVTQHLK